MSKWKKAILVVLLGGLSYLTLGLGVAMPFWGGRCMPTTLRAQTHTDFTMPGTKWIPRRFTCFCLPTKGPKVLWYSAGTEFVNLPSGELAPKPIPKPGEWQFSVVQMRPSLPFYWPYWAWTSGTGMHYRAGVRWDDVDKFYVFPSLARHQLDRK